VSGFPSARHIRREHGYVGLYPLDTAHNCAPGDLSRSIFEANCQLIDSADAVLANLRYFRGHEPDSGTVWEVSYALAKGKPVIGYMPPGGSLIERMGSAVVNGVDREGNQVENFGHPLNLMLVHSLTALVFGVEENLEGLQAALAEWSHWLATQTSEEVNGGR